MSQLHNNAFKYSGAGFTLIEIAIVLLIVSLVIGGMVFGASSLIQSGRTHDAMKIASDLSASALEFRQRYHYLPGDFPVNAASPEIPGLSPLCMSGGANAGDGNGQIQLTESACVPEQLSKSGFIKGSVDPLTGLIAVRTSYGLVRVIANSASSVFAGPNPLPTTIVNVLEFANLPCEIAVEIDSKLDDGNLATGKVRASVAACTPKALNDPVPFFAVAL